MKNLLIGSRALGYWFGSWTCTKKDTDWDVISSRPIEGTEWHDPWLLNNEEIENYATDKTIIFNDEVLHVVHPIGLAIIKRSHLWRSLSFGKHITHYHKYLRRFTKEFSQHDIDVLARRTKMTMEAYPQQGPNLRQPVEEFFTDAVTKKFSHDWLHELYAFTDRPIYTKMQRDPSTAWCEKDMWDEFTHTQKMYAVAEEALVIATERFLVPNDFNFPAKLAYHKAVEKICTTLCKGWFRDFAIDNYPQALAMFDAKKVSKVKSILEC